LPITPEIKKASRRYKENEMYNFLAGFLGVERRGESLPPRPRSAAK
jgi:hypothetical protein